MGDRPRILHDKGTDRPILMSPGRLSRPRTTGADQDRTEDCPFCAGNEHLTPPESDAVRADGSAKDSPGWSARAFPNLFPAIEHHEVIARGLGHGRALLVAGEIGVDLELSAHRRGGRVKAPTEDLIVGADLIPAVPGDNKRSISTRRGDPGTELRSRRRRVDEKLHAYLPPGTIEALSIDSEAIAILTQAVPRGEKAPVD